MYVCYHVFCHYVQRGNEKLYGYAQRSTGSISISDFLLNYAQKVMGRKLNKQSLMKISTGSLGLQSIHLYPVDVEASKQINL